MIRLIDTSAWIETLIGSPLGALLVAGFPARERWLVPTIVQLELAKWLFREAPEERANEVIAFTETCLIAPLDTRIALSAAEISRRCKLPTADAIVYATALEYRAELITCDAHFSGLPGVSYTPKTRV